MSRILLLLATALLSGCFDVTVENAGTVPVRCTAQYHDAAGTRLSTNLGTINPGETVNGALDNTDFISTGTVVISCGSVFGWTRCRIPDDPTTRDFLAMTTNDGEVDMCVTGVTPPM